MQHAVFNKIIEHLKNNNNRRYCSSKKCQTNIEREEMKYLWDNSMAAMRVFNGILDNCARENELVSIGNQRVLDGSCTKMRDYFWGQMKDVQYLNNPESISLFFEVLPGLNYVYIRVSLDIDDRNDYVRQLDRHNELSKQTFLDDISYVCSNKGHKDLIIFDKAESARASYESGFVKKIMPSFYIDYEDKTETEIINNINKAVKSLLPFYNTVINKDLGVIIDD